MLLSPPTRTLFPYTTLFRSERHRAALVNEVAPELRRFILGETDSEVLFFILLTAMRSEGALTAPRSAADVARAVRSMTAVVDRKSTRLNSSHLGISYAVFCLNATLTTHTYSLSLHDALPI